MSRRNPPLYCTLTSIAMQGHQNRGKRHNESGQSSIFYIASRIGWVSALQVCMVITYNKSMDQPGKVAILLVVR